MLGVVYRDYTSVFEAAASLVLGYSQGKNPWTVNFLNFA